MKKSLPKLKRDFVGSIVNQGAIYGVYAEADKDYHKGEEIYFGSIQSYEREMFDAIIKSINSKSLSYTALREECKKAIKIIDDSEALKQNKPEKSRSDEVEEIRSRNARKEKRKGIER